MRRRLLVLVLLASIAVGWAEAASAAVHPPSGSPQTDRASRLPRLARRVVAYARHQVGVGYSWGGMSPQTGFDCSGLVYAAYRSIGWGSSRARAGISCAWAGRSASRGCGLVTCSSPRAAATFSLWGRRTP